MGNIRKKIGSSLRELRLSQRGMTVYRLSQLTGIQQSTIARIEDGKFSFRIDTVETLCAALGAELKVVKSLNDLSNQ